MTTEFLLAKTLVSVYAIIFIGDKNMDRDAIINQYDKDEFKEFLESDNSGLVLELFNDEGISILRKCEVQIDRIRYILAFSPYKDELLLNNNFLDVVLNANVDFYHASFRHLNDEICDALLKRSIELGDYPYKVANLFNSFNISYKLKTLDNWPYSTDFLYSILMLDEPEVVQKIISNYEIDLSDQKINLERFFDKIKEDNLNARAKRNLGEKEEEICEIAIPVHMINEKLVDKLWDNYDIFVIRKIINDAEFCTDFSPINEAIKEREKQLIENSNEFELIPPFKEIYESCREYRLAEYQLDEEERNGIFQDETYDYYSQKEKTFIQLRKKFEFLGIDFSKVNRLYKKEGIEKVEEYFRRLSDNSLSNYVIDYLFEENYHNITIDIQELLNFYYRGNIALPEERIEIYDKLNNIDLLTTEEKRELFSYLKDFNMIEIFYDDMSMSRHIVAEAIKEYSLSSKMLKQYRDEKLSSQYGVDVYNMQDSYFFGIVKNGRGKKDYLPAGHSYSLIGLNSVVTFGNPKDSNTYLYDSDSMNPNQLIHAFPFDSFTYYHPFEHSKNATKRVNMLLMPDELLDYTATYNELLLLERGTSELGIEAEIPELKKIALYCVDKIRKQDIEKAKMQDVGIILVSSSGYKKVDYEKLNPFEHNPDDYSYFDGICEKEKFEARRNI